jgi:hypothetical protein
MDRVLVFLPSSFAGRRLGELLAGRAAADGLVLRPPEILTVGTLPEKLYQARLPFANELAQIQVWVHVLRHMSPDELRPLLIEVPSAHNLQPWAEIAQMILGLHRELATDLLLFSDVAALLVGTGEEARWRVLDVIQHNYLSELDRLGMWDIQTARRVAIEKGEPRADRDLVVLGAVDLNRAQRRFMDAVANRVTVLVGAPKSWQAGFDIHGALEPNFWQNLQVTLDPSILHVRASTVDAAKEVARQLAYLGDQVATRDVTIGVPDESLVPILQQYLERSKVRGRWGAGTLTQQSSPFRLLEGIVDYVLLGDIESLAVAMRLPAVDRYLRDTCDLPVDYIQRFDQYRMSTFIKSVNIPYWPEYSGRECMQSIV